MICAKCKSEFGKSFPYLEEAVKKIKKGKIPESSRAKLLNLLKGGKK